MITPADGSMMIRGEMAGPDFGTGDFGATSSGTTAGAGLAFADEAPVPNPPMPFKLVIFLPFQFGVAGTELKDSEKFTTPNLH